MLDAAPDIVVGRALSSYTVAGIQGNRETITYTVYNGRDTPLTGVRLTTALASGVTFVDASAPADRSGQGLAWSLGTIAPFDRASVQVTVSLAGPVPTLLDTGAGATGTRGAAAVSDTAPPAALRGGTIPAVLLASTPDADTGDPFIQEKAAELDYDPQRIFAYLRDGVGYESYAGSLRGARGTLWSGAGNSLDEASLGVALLRASGIPARYAHGTLAPDAARALVATMFPDPLRAFGCLEPGTAPADPLGDSQLLSEAADHYWVQFDAGAGFVDADGSGLPGIGLGTAPAAAASTFAEVADALRHKVRVELKAELVSQAGALFGLTPTAQTVLDRTFNTVELVGRPLSIGHFVSSGGIVTPLFSNTTITYSPYIVVDQGDGDPGSDPLFRGTDYQEVFTNFPLSSVALTGLFVDVSTIGPELGGQRAVDTIEKTWVDRLGFAARQGQGGPVQIGGAVRAALTDFDIMTLLVDPSAISEAASAAGERGLARAAAEVQAAVPPPTAGTIDRAALEAALVPIRRATMGLTAGIGQRFRLASDLASGSMAGAMLVHAYPDSPRIVAVTNTALADRQSPEQSRTALQVDILRNHVRAYAWPGQAADAPAFFRTAKGLVDSSIEQQVLPPPPAGAAEAGALTILSQALSRPGASLVLITADTLTRLIPPALPADAVALITRAVQAGRVVLVPTLTADIGGRARAAWLEIVPETGETIAVSDDGAHAAEDEYPTVQVGAVSVETGVVDAEGVGAGFARSIAEHAADLIRSGRFRDAKVLIVNFEGAFSVVSTLLTFELWNVLGPIEIAAFGVRGFGIVTNFFDFYRAFDPPTGDLILTAPASPEFAGLGTGATGGIDLAVAPDARLTVPVNGAQVPTAFKAGIKNLTSSRDTFTVDVTGLPAGFEAETSLPRIAAGAGETAELGICIHPGGVLPPPGTPISFTVTATSTNDPSVKATRTFTFSMPEVHGVNLVSSPVRVSTSPGDAVTATITVTAVGNVPESVTMTATASPGLAVGGVGPVSLAPGQSATQTITLTPSASTPLGSLLSAKIDATFGPASAPQTATARVGVLVRSAQTVAIARAADAAVAASNDQLSATLTALGQALSDLQADPTRTALFGQLSRLLGNLANLLGADPALAPLVPRLQPLTAAAAAGDLPGLLAAAPAIFADLAGVLDQQSRERFTATLAPANVDLQAGEGKVLSLRLANTGVDPVTLTLGVGPLPSGVTATPAESQVTLAPGEVRDVPVTLAQSLASSTVIVLRMTASAPLVSHATIARIAVQAAPVDVVSVAASPSSVAVGVPVGVSAVISNGANVARPALAHIEVLASNGAVVATPPDVPITLATGSASAPIDLGPVPTTGLADGLYTLRVSLRATDGTPIPGRSAQAPFFVGVPIGATVSASPIVVPPGTSTVRTTIGVTSVLTGSTVQGELTLSLPGVTASASSAFDGRFLPYRAIDGSLETSWFTKSGDAANLGKAPFLDVNLPTDATVTQLQVFGNRQFADGFDFFAGHFQLFDGSDHLLYDSGEVPLPAPNRDATVAVPSVAGVRTVRFLVTADENDHAGLSELKVFGTAPLPPPAPPSPPARLTDPNDPPGGVLGATVQTFISLGVDPLTTDIENSVWVDPAGFRLGSFLKGSEARGGVTDPTILSVDGTSVDGTDAGNANRRDFFWVADEGNTVDFGGAFGGAPSKGLIWDLGGQANQAVVFALVDHGPLPQETLESTVWLSNDPDAPDSGWTRAVLDRVYLQGWSPDPNISDGFVGVYRLPGGQTFRYVSVSWGGPAALNRDGDDEIDAVGGLTESGLGVGTISLDVRHQLPAGGFAVDPASVSPAGAVLTPSEVRWTAQVPGAGPPALFQLAGQVTGMAPGETRAISLGTTVTAVVDAGGATPTTFTIPLPPVIVAAAHIIDLAPPVQAAARGGSATYDVVLTNPLPTPATYTLTTAGLDGFGVGLAPSVTVGPGQTVHTPLTVTVPSGIAAGPEVFTVFVASAEGARDSVGGQLDVSADVALQSRAVVAAVRPTRAVAGRGTSATYQVVVTNDGDATDTYRLSGDFPAGFTGTFAEATVTLAPGLGNARTVLLTLAAPAGAPAGDVPFRVTATSTADATVAGTADGTLAVVANGVRVSLDPATAAPGASLRMTVTNTGTVTDTFDLALAGPAALVASLATKAVTVAPGASRVITIATTAVTFAVPGPLDLSAIATSRGNPAVRDAASADLTVGRLAGLSADLTPAVRILPIPGTSSFVLLVTNTGNVEDTFEAVVTGTSGPVRASLAGPNGLSSRRIPLLRLPGLATGAILLDADLMSPGQGTVTVSVRSRTDPAMIATRTATVTTRAATVATTTRIVAAPNPSTFGDAVTLTAIVAPASGQARPSGNVVFTIDGRAQAPVPLRVVNGQARATLIATGLAVGRHSVLASYAGTAGFGSSASAATPLTVNRAPSTTVLVTVPGLPVAGRPTRLVATVAPHGPARPTGTVTFKDGNKVLATVRLSGLSADSVRVAQAGGAATASTTVTLGPGRHALVAIYSGDVDYTPSFDVVARQVNSPGADGPRVAAVSRLGVHAQPTTIVLAFDQPLDPASAQDAANYAIVTLGGPGRGGSQVGRRIGVATAVYDPRAHTVTLSPAERLDVHNRYRLTVRGAAPGGVRGASGRLLDGRGDGRPGSDFVGTISFETLAATGGPGAGVSPAAVDALAASGALMAGSPASFRRTAPPRSHA